MAHETEHLIMGNMQWVTYGSPGDQPKVIFLELHPAQLLSLIFRLKAPSGSLRYATSASSRLEMVIQHQKSKTHMMNIYTLFAVEWIKMRRSSVRWRTPISDRQRAIMLISGQ